jgi:hypothetical protein
MKNAPTSSGHFFCSAGYRAFLRRLIGLLACQR